MAKYKVDDRVWIREGEGSDMVDGKWVPVPEPREAGTIVDVDETDDGPLYTIEPDDPDLCPHLDTPRYVNEEYIEGLAV